jgi:hypothetical protein
MNKKLGFYLVDNIEFESKIQACIYATQHNKELKWVFNDHIFQNYNWATEPDLSLDQLYDARARQIRESYDYVIISYSGGSDSHNLLTSFLRQNLKVDELIVNTMSKGNSKFAKIDKNNFLASNGPASEHELQTVPRLKEIRDKHPDIKITVLDLTDFLFESFLTAEDESWITGRKEGLNPLNVTRYNYLYFKEVRNQFDKDKKIALVMGVDKPRLFIHTNGYLYLNIPDRTINVTSVNDYVKEYPNATVEFFYLSPDAIDILCKQAHVVKRWLELFPDKQALWAGKDLTNARYRLIHERIYRTLLYTTWDENWYQADKSTRDWHSEFDTWFIEGHKDTRQHQIWSKGLEYVEKNAANFLKINNGVADGLKVFTHYYKIAPVKNFIIVDQHSR